MTYSVEKTESNLIVKINKFPDVYTLPIGNHSSLDEFQKYLLFQGALTVVRVRLSMCKGDIHLLKKTAHNLVLMFNSRIPLDKKEKVYKLSLIQKAFASVKKGVKGFEHWEDINNPEVCKEVYLTWAGYSRREQNQLRKMPHIQQALDKLIEIGC